MADRYCDVVGYKVPDSECAEIKIEKFHECDDCPSQAGQEVKDIMGEGKRKYTMSAAALKARREVGKKPKRKISSEGYTPPPTDGPCCKMCGIKCTETLVFDLKDQLCETCIVGEMLTPKTAGSIPPINTEQTITIDFSNHPERYIELMTLAANEMRTPAMQVLYLLTKGDFSGLSHKV